MGITYMGVMDMVDVTVWWKIPNLFMSSEQMRRVGLYPAGQLTLWL